MGTLDARKSPFMRRLASTLAVVCLVSLIHTVDHDALFGEEHHDDGDAAGGTVELVLLALGAMGVIAAVGGLLRYPPPRMIRALTTRPRSLLPRDVSPMSRAGPGPGLALRL